MGTRALVGALLVAALGAGCSGDPEPKIADPSPSVSSPAASPSPTETEAADPEQAYREFIDGYVAAISESLSTGDPSTWLGMSSPSCSNCPVYAANVTGAYANGGRIQGASWKATRARFVETTDVGNVWYATVKTSEERWLDGNGMVVKVVPASVNYLAFAIEGEPRELKMADFRFRQP